MNKDEALDKVNRELNRRSSLPLWVPLATFLIGLIIGMVSC